MEFRQFHPKSSAGKHPLLHSSGKQLNIRTAKFIRNSHKTAMARHEEVTAPDIDDDKIVFEIDLKH